MEVKLMTRRFDGSMSQPQRAATVESFGKPTKEPLILLISLKAGGVGLNLYVQLFRFRFGAVCLPMEVRLIRSGPWPIMSL
jgi:hypothetical protein